MRSIDCETLIIGAGFYGMALAKTAENSILIDRGYRIGSEYSASLRVNSFSGSVRSEIGREFLNRLRCAGFINDSGAIYSAPAAYLLAEMMTEINAFFATELLSIEEIGTGYCATVFNSEGRQRIFADRIINSTSEYALQSGVECVKKLNVLLSEPTEEHTEYDCFTDCYVYGFGVGANENMIQARKRLYEYLSRKESGAVFTADVFDYELPLTVKRAADGIYTVPSVGFGNPVSAVDAGGGGLEYVL